MVQEKVTVCTRCKEKKSKNDTVLLCNLMYPDTKEDLKYSFEDIVSMSMCPMQTTPAWCEQCKKYQTTSQTRNLQTLPNILSLNAGMDSAQAGFVVKEKIPIQQSRLYCKSLLQLAQNFTLQIAKCKSRFNSFGEFFSKRETNADFYTREYLI